jgi:hypothetical protein
MQRGGLEMLDGTQRFAMKNGGPREKQRIEELRCEGHARQPAEMTDNEAEQHAYL